MNDAHLQNRLQFHPRVLELYLTQADVMESQRINEWIGRLRRDVSNIYLHHPTTFNGEYLDIISATPDRLDFYNQSTARLIEICRREGVRLVIHAHYVGTESADWTDPKRIAYVRERIEHFQALGGEFLLWENSIEGIFSSQNPTWIRDIVRPLDLSLCVDISHVFIAMHGDNDRLVHVLHETQDYAKYYHVVDSQGDKHDGLALGDGRIDWKRVINFVRDKDFIYEIDLRASDNADCAPMIRSYEYLKQFLDRDA